MKKYLKLLALAGLIIITITSCSKASNNKSTSKNNNKTSQVLPVDSNPIVNTSTKPGIEITKADVEDNEDPVTKKAINDKLQLTINNTGSKEVSNAEIFYVMKDTKTSKVENYYQKLDGLIIPAGASKTIFFDNETGPLHFPENKYSLYRTSTNEVTFTIEISAPGYKTAAASAVKAEGTGEVPGE